MTESTRSERGRTRRVIVVGGGVAGLSTAIGLARRRVPVLLVSLLPEYRSPSVIRQDGITVCTDPVTLDRQVARTLACGSFLAHEPPAREMLRRAAPWVEELVALGVPFERAADGSLQGHVCEMTPGPLAVRAGAATGRHVVRALYEQVLRYQSESLTDDRGLTIAGEKLVERLIGWELRDLVRDDRGTVVGIVAEQLGTMKIKAFAGDAVCLATGGYGMLFGPSSGLSSTGSGAAIAARHGAVMANLDLLSIEATALASAELPLPIGAAARAAGGRLWVPKNPKDARRPGDIPESERSYVFERQQGPVEGLEPGARLARVLVSLGREGRLGTNPAMRPELPGVAYLDLSHLTQEVVEGPLREIRELAHHHAGIDVLAAPVPVYPMVSGVLGGLWVDHEPSAQGGLTAESPRNQATSLPGLYAAGDVEYSYHGGGALAGNLLTRCHTAGSLAATAIQSYRAALTRSAMDLPASTFDRVEEQVQKQDEALLERADRKSSEDARTVFALRAALAGVMTAAAGLGRDRPSARSLDSEIDQLLFDLRQTPVTDGATRLNQTMAALRHLQDMLLLARMVASCGRERAPDAIASPSELELRSTLVRLDENGEPECLKEFSYSAGGSAVAVTAKMESRGVDPRDPERQTAWSIGAPAAEG